jgi:hypothetical protein
MKILGANLFVTAIEIVAAAIVVQYWDICGKIP